MLATDIAAGILEFAAQNVRRAGFSNVDIAAMDGENLDVPEGSFDAVVSRLGLIYFPDQHRALTEIHRTLRPGGRLSSVVYATPDRNGFFALPVGIIRRIADLPAPAPGLPGPFSLAGPGVAEAAYAAAGFVDVTVTAIPSPVRMPSAQECVRFEYESFGALHQMLSGVSQAERDAAWREIEEVPPSVFGFAVAVHPRDPRTAWLVPAIKDERRVPVDGALVVSRTRDGGASFEVLRSGLPQSHAYDLVYRHGLAIDASGERLAFGSTTGGCWISEDQGDTWQALEARLPPVHAITFA